MRGVDKIGPPSGDVSGGSQPISWIQARKRLAAVVEVLSPDAVRQEHFDTLNKPRLRQVLLDEQRYLCVFCERQLRGDDDFGFSSVRIAHWKPIKHDKGQALEWKNLYASCDCQWTCDRRQGSADLGLPPPSNFPYQRVLKYTPRGEVQLEADTSGLLTADQRAALGRALGDPTRRTSNALEGDPDSPLNLNQPALCSQRAAELDGLRDHIRKRFEGRTATLQDRATVAAELLNRRRRPRHVSVQVAWLERRVARAQASTP